MTTKHVLSHMQSTLINWKAIRSALDPVIQGIRLRVNFLTTVTGKTIDEIENALLSNENNFNNAKTAEEVYAIMLQCYGVVTPDANAGAHQLFSIITFMGRNNGKFKLRKYMASNVILMPAPIEDNLRRLFKLFDLNGDGFLDENELVEGIKLFFNGVIECVTDALDDSQAVIMGIQNLNKAEAKEAIGQLVEVYNEEKIIQIKNNCIAAAGVNGQISYKKWIEWFPQGAPEAFGSAKILFDPIMTQ